MRASGLIPRMAPFMLPTKVPAVPKSVSSVISGMADAAATGLP